MSSSREDQTAAVAMRLVDRRDFVASNPYEDCAVPIGFNVVISAPHVHAIGFFSYAFWLDFIDVSIVDLSSFLFSILLFLLIRPFLV
jgi:hypothetical protein